MTRPQPAKFAPVLTFEISAEHIATAIPRDSGHCMIADALAEAYPNATYISVDLATIRFTDPAAGRRYIYLTPNVAQLALIAWDNGEPVEPFKINRLRAAQMVLTGSASRAKRAARAADEPKRRESAELYYPNGVSSGQVPLKIGGEAPPTGPLAVGSGGRRGKRREYGIRALIR
jgi:hypothetical protein